MLFATASISEPLARELSELDLLRTRLGVRAGTAGPWLGSFRRRMRASSAESSIEIEGFRVHERDRLALATGRTTPDPDDDDRMALSCYARAMDHVGVMADDPAFRWLDRVILDLHFDACYFQRDSEPGRYRRGGVEVSGPGHSPPAYVGPAPDAVPRLMDEVVDWLEHGDLDAHIVVRAAMAHLHLVSVHPFRDGNGRVSRIAQSLVLAREGVLAPELGSIEEYLGRNTDAYYSALQDAQGGSYQPERDASQWVRFCVRAHADQAGRRLDEIARAGARWTHLDDVVKRRGWPDRVVIALEQSLFQSLDRASYAGEADVSAPTASNDLRRLLDAGLVVRRGRGRATRYIASESLGEGVRRLERRAVGEAKRNA